MLQKNYVFEKVYHGTDKNFEQFICPAYFSETKRTAEFFAKRSLEIPKVLECKLVLKNPLIVDIQGQSWGGFHLEDEKIEEACIKYAADGDLEEEQYFQEEGLSIGFLAGYAENHGYDGVIAYNCMEENGSSETQYVVFHPENITIKKRKEVML